MLVRVQVQPDLPRGPQYHKMEVYAWVHVRSLTYYPFIEENETTKKNSFQQLLLKVSELSHYE